MGCTSGPNGQNCGPSKNAIAIGIGTGVAIVGALLLLILLIVWQSKRKRNDSAIVVDDLEDRMEMAVEEENPTWRYPFDQNAKAQGERGVDTRFGQTPSASITVPAAEPAREASLQTAPAVVASPNARLSEEKRPNSESGTADDAEEMIGVPVLLDSQDVMRPPSEQHTLNDLSSNSASRRSSEDLRQSLNIAPS